MILPTWVSGMILNLPESFTGSVELHCSQGGVSCVEVRRRHTEKEVKRETTTP